MAGRFTVCLSLSLEDRGLVWKECGMNSALWGFMLPERGLVWKEEKE